MSRRLAAWTAWSLDHPRTIVALVLAVSALACAGWARLDFDFSNEALFAQNDDVRVRYDAFTREFGTDDNVAYLALETGDAYSEASLRRCNDVTQALGGLRDVARVYSLATVAHGARMGPRDGERLRTLVQSSSLTRRFLSDDAGTVQVYAVAIAEGRNTDRVRARLLGEADKVLARLAPGVPVHRAGLPVIQREYIRVMIRDQVRFFPLVSALLVVVLWWSLRDLRLTVVCYASVATAVLWTGGLMGWLGLPVNVLNHVLPTLLLVVGIADLLHLSLRFREESRGRGAREAAVLAARGVGTACLLTSVTTAMGFGSLCLISNPTVAQFGLTAAMGMGLAFAAAFSVYPVLLVYWVHRQGAGEPRMPFRRGLERLGAGVVGHAGWILIAVTAVTGVSAWGAVRMKVQNHIFEELRADNAVYRDNGWFERTLGGVLPLELVLGLPAPLPGTGHGAGEVFELLGRLERTLLAEKQAVSSVVSLRAFRGIPGTPETVRFLSQDRKRLRISARCKAMDTHAFNALRDRLQRDCRPLLPPGYDLQFTGRGIMVSHAAESLVAGMGKSIAGAFLVISLTLGLLFGSWRAGAVSMLPNVAPLVVAMGVMGATGITLRISTTLIFSIALGIAVDDTIHFLMRFRMERRPGVDVPTALQRTTAGAGAGMVLTSLLLVIGFSVLMFSAFRATMHFALLGGVIIVVALAADLLFLPALILKLGWWEGRPVRAELKDEEPVLPAPIQD